MLHSITDRFLSRFSPLWRTDEDMARYGIDRLRSFAKFYNRWRYATQHRLHREAFESAFPSLLAGEGTDRNVWPPKIMFKDGWVRADSMTLPHIDRAD